MLFGIEKCKLGKGELLIYKPLKKKPTGFIALDPASKYPKDDKNLRECALIKWLDFLCILCATLTWFGHELRNLTLLFLFLLKRLVYLKLFIERLVLFFAFIPPLYSVA